MLQLLARDCCSWRPWRSAAAAGARLQQHARRCITSHVAASAGARPPLAISGDLVLVWQHLHCDTWLLAGVRPSHTSSFRRRTTAAACLLCRDELLVAHGCCSWRPTAATSGGLLLLLLAAHCCYSWRPTAATPGGPLLLLLAAHDFLLPTEVADGSSCNWYTSTWRLLLHLAAAPAPSGCFCKRLPAPPDWWQQHHLVACSSSPDALQHLKPYSTGPAAVLPDALAACTSAAPALGGSGISSTCVTLVSSPSSA
ncbi:unnamed protein product [Closterium sp. NIES-54]